MPVFRPFLFEFAMLSSLAAPFNLFRHSDKSGYAFPKLIHYILVEAQYIEFLEQVQNFPQLVIKFILKNIRTASNPASTN